MNSRKKIKAQDFNKQPGWVKVLNAAWKTTYPLGTQANLEKDSLIKAARKATGLHDLGSYFPEEALEQLLTSVRTEANLHPLGQFITRQRLINLLAVRLRAEDLFKKHPEILEQPLYPVMLVIGLQRTGTTKLQRLLAADPDNRALLSWEALNPAPINGDIKDGKNRIKLARTSEKGLKIISPAFFAIHPVEHLAPEEDVLLLDVSFMSQTAEATMHVPSYAAWVEKTDLSPAYEYMVKLLKLLQWQRPGKRWVLKTPNHLEFLDLVNKHFGDVQYIWPHRNIYESIPSFLSMVSHASAIFSNQTDIRKVTEHWIRKNGYMLDKARKFIKKEDHASQFTHLFYNDLVENTMGVMQQIYNDRKEPFTPELEKVFRQAEKQNTRGKYGQHVYALEDFGIDESYIDRYTKEYQEFQQKLSRIGQQKNDNETTK